MLRHPNAHGRWRLLASVRARPPLEGATFEVCARGVAVSFSCPLPFFGAAQTHWEVHISRRCHSRAARTPQCPDFSFLLSLTMDERPTGSLQHSASAQHCLWLSLSVSTASAVSPPPAPNPCPQVHMRLYQGVLSAPTPASAWTLVCCMQQPTGAAPQFQTVAAPAK